MNRKKIPPASGGEGPAGGRKSRCAGCGTEYPESANFCKKCGKKLKAECDCHWLHRKFDCGMDKCPGARILVVLARRAKDQADPLPAHSQNRSQIDGERPP